MSVIKMNVNQLGRGEANPRLVAMDFKNPKRLKKGFKGLTILACHRFAKGGSSLEDSLLTLEMMLRESFKDNPLNRKKIIHCKLILSNFNAFLEYYGLKCVLSKSRFKYKFDSFNSLSCESVGLYQNQFGKYAGVIFVDDEFDYTSLKAHWERYMIAFRMGVQSENVDLYIFRLNDFSHEKLPIRVIDKSELLERSLRVFRSVRIELDNLESA